eukprot:TRINITY_DN3422_c0_g1_i2.p2 TRINITY_DN3422_c0_g1~~TRINITY_DN3422_c0_g1_i2.p2  ORF type:complete len:177 (+),score=26.68 TRINITY_DN3422_c0_g1_i2:157-687(+)
MDSNLAVEIFLSDDDALRVACSRAEEDCVEDGCFKKTTVLGALKELVACTGMETTGVLGLLCEDVRVSALNQGIAVMYGPIICVVRRESGSWPFAVVRRKNKGMWMCHACRQGPGSCKHERAAGDAGRNEQSEGLMKTTSSTTSVEYGSPNEATRCTRRCRGRPSRRRGHWRDTRP